jgi:hypothetical protein
MKYELGESEEQTEQPTVKPKSKGKFLGCCIVLLLVGLTGFFWLRSGQRQSFPKLPVGTYVGEVSEILDNKPSQFVVESLISDEMLVSLSDVQRIATVPAVENTEEAEFIYPLIVKYGDLKLRFVGSENGADYSGVIYNQKDGTKLGTWTLSKVETVTVGEIPVVVEDRLKASLELSDVVTKINNGKATIAKQQEEIEKLTNFITDEDLLRSKAEKKFNEISEKLEEERKVFQEKLKEAAEAESRLVLAQTVTPMGQLVSLARKTLDRENRWIDSALGGVLPPNGEDFKAELDKAKKILGVKQAIAEEHEYIKNLQMLQADQYPSSRPNSFGSLWGGR